MRGVLSVGPRKDFHGVLELHTVGVIPVCAWFESMHAVYCLRTLRE